jgi:hypothetical protein
VGQDCRTNTVGGYAQSAVFPVGFRAGTLKSPAVNHVTFSVYLNYVARAGNLLRSAEGIESNIHLKNTPSFFFLKFLR